MNKQAKMDKSVQITLIVVIGVVLLGVLGFSYIVPSTSNTVKVTGSSSIDVVPDLVTVYFSIETKGSTSEEARNENVEIVDEVITSLMKQGFERSEIQTTSFQIYPNYDYSSSSQRITGYTARHDIRVELSTDKMNDVGRVVDAGVDAGANINYISFELTQEKQNEYKAKAIKQAGEDARIKAEAMAEGLGKKLGPLVSVSDSSFDYNPWMLYEGRGVASDVTMAKEAASNIQPGDQTIYAQVSATFKLR